MRSFWSLQLAFELVPPSSITIGGNVQRISSGNVHYSTVSEILFLYVEFATKLKSYIISSHSVESANVEWMDCRGGVGGSMGVGWVFLWQVEIVRRAFKFCTAKYLLFVCKYCTWGCLCVIFRGDLQHPNVCVYIVQGWGCFWGDLDVHWPFKT